MSTPGTTYVQTLGDRLIPPSIQRLITVANDLDGALREQIVFTGGAREGRESAWKMGGVVT